MEYASWGDGPKTLLWIQGGPGSDVPRGLFGRASAWQFRPFLKDGYTVWSVTRRRHMPAGYTVADMADDHARLIEEEFGGRVDVVVGISYGGLIAQYLAANHPDRFDHLVLALAAGGISEWGKDVDRRWALARSADRTDEAGEVFLECVLPGDRWRWLRRRVGPLTGRLFSGAEVPAEDLRVEAEAEVAFDAREILPRIEVPVLLLCGEQDRFFTPDIVEETARLIPDCTVVRYPGKGHLRAGTSGRLPDDVLAFVHRQETARGC